MISGFMLAVTLSIDDFAVTVFTIGNEGLKLFPPIFIGCTKRRVTLNFVPFLPLYSVLVLVLLVIINRHFEQKNYKNERKINKLMVCVCALFSLPDA